MNLKLKFEIEIKKENRKENIKPTCLPGQNSTIPGHFATAAVHMICATSLTCGASGVSLMATWPGARAAASLWDPPVGFIPSRSCQPLFRFHGTHGYRHVPPENPANIALNRTSSQSIREASGNHSSFPHQTIGLLSPCHTRILGVQNPGANINTRCAGTKSHTYDA
jgi:hypothetical protein